MGAQRTFTVPPSKSSTRGTLDASNHAIVDTVLKDLRKCTRRLQAALASQHVDLQVLEKLYYKGNNQHRTALFWRRVSDIRRFGRRVESADMHVVVENLRLSFWGDSVQPNSKIVKGPWLYYPHHTSVQTILRRLIDCHTLVTHMHEHVTKAHNHFNLELQTGAFLQLILTLTAISSRVAVLLTEIQSAIEESCQALCKLLSLLNPDDKVQLPQWLKPAASLTATASSTPQPHVSAVGTSQALPQLEGDEDTGMVLTSETSVINKVQDGRTTPGSRPDGMPTSVPALDFMFANTKSQTSLSTIIRTATPKESVHQSPAKTIVKRIGNKRNSEDVSQVPKLKKKKKKDEIDDIFGF